MAEALPSRGWVIAHLLSVQIRPGISLPATRRPQQLPSIPVLRAADQGVAETLTSGLSDNTHRSTRLSRVCSPNSVATWACASCRRISPHRRPLPGRPGRVRRQYRHPTPRHQRHLEGPRVGEAGIALPGPGRARLTERMGKAACQAPAPVRRAHQRHTGCDPAHRHPAPPSRSRH